LPPAESALLSGDALLAAITDAMVALHLRYYHRVPTSARTLFLEDDLVACTLTGVYTDVEKTMIELEHQDVVKGTRQNFQQAMQHKYVSEIERLCGRKVITFISHQHVGPDKAVELFLLAPSTDPSQQAS